MKDNFDKYAYNKTNIHLIRWSQLLNKILYITESNYHCIITEKCDHMFMSKNNDKKILRILKRL
jgi:hypothetical protein